MLEQFDQPFTAQTVPGSNGPNAVYLSFDTSNSQTVQAKLGISYVSVPADAAEAFAPVVARLTGK